MEDLRRQKQELVSRIMLVFVKPGTTARLIDNLKLAFASAPPLLVTVAVQAVVSRTLFKYISNITLA